MSREGRRDRSAATAIDPFVSYRAGRGQDTLSGDVKKAIATGAALRERGLRNEEPAPESGVVASVFWGDATTVGNVLAMSPDEFQRWTTHVQARRRVGDD